jgi:adenylate cyclase
VTRTLSTGELADETGVSLERVEWLTAIGILKPPEPDAFRFSDGFRVKMVAALLDGGFSADLIERATAEGYLNLDESGEYLPRDPGPRSERTFAEFVSSAGSRAELLPAMFEVLGLPEPDPSEAIHVHEEELLVSFLEAWSLAPDDETLMRAARLIAEGTRLAALGWTELLDERVAEPVRERLLSGEVERFPEEVTRAFGMIARVAPRLVEWLSQRYLEQRAVAGIVEGFERFLAFRGLVPAPPPTAPPAVVFVDLSGYTRLTEEHGDEAAVRFAVTLQREADGAAVARGGRLVKLLGDGAMLRFPDAGRGVDAAMALIGSLRDKGMQARAGVHAGPLIERDLDLFGRTVNLASRIAEVAGPGEVLVTSAVMDALDDPRLGFEAIDQVVLKGVAEPVSLFRARSAPA